MGLTHLCQVFLMLFWLSGFVVAEGFWSTLACIFPLWAWYLSLEAFFGFASNMAYLCR